MTDFQIAPGASEVRNVPNVLGLPLATARAILVREGFTIEADEVRSKKGVEGDSLRVVRQLFDESVDPPMVRLVYCEFRTSVPDPAMPQ